MEENEKDTMEIKKIEANYNHTKQAIFDLNHTVEVIKSLEKHYKRKRQINIYYDIIKFTKIVRSKNWFKNHGLIIETIPTTNGKTFFGKLKITCVCSNKISDRVFADLEIKPDSNDIDQKSIYAPIIYYMFPEIQKSARILVYKTGVNDDNSGKFLVHRSNFNYRPLEHPGGHIEYVEIDYQSQMIYTGHEYLNSLIKTDSNDLNLINTKPSVISWIRAGVLRELREESGVVIKNGSGAILNLVKIGSHTYYYSAKVNIDTIVLGPITKYKHEIFMIQDKMKLNKSNAKKTMHISNRFASLNGTYYDSDDEIHDPENHNVLTLDIFWNKKCNRKTHHAWITSEDMIKFWETKYLDHIHLMIDSVIR